MKQVTHDAIVEAGEALFAERGLGGLRVEAIAGRAGVAVGTLYNYFEDHRALRDAVLDASARRLSARLMEGLFPATAGVARQLERLLANALEVMGSGLRPDALAFAHEGEGRPAGSKGTLFFRAVFRVAEQVLGEAVQAGALRAEDASLYPALLVGMLRGVLAHDLGEKAARPLSACVSPMARFFLEGAAVGGRP